MEECERGQRSHIVGTHPPSWHTFQAYLLLGYCCCMLQAKLVTLYIPKAYINNIHISAPVRQGCMRVDVRYHYVIIVLSLLPNNSSRWPKTEVMVMLAND